MRLKIALLAFALALGIGATAVAFLAPTSVSAAPKPDCPGC
jgi:hypothetical protein